MNEGDNQTMMAVAIGRIEEGVSSLNKKVDGLAEGQRKQADTLTRHEVDIELLKSRQGPKIHWFTILVGIVAAFGAVLALLDRFYLP